MLQEKKRMRKPFLSLEDSHRTCFVIEIEPLISMTRRTEATYSDNDTGELISCAGLMPSGRIPRDAFDQ